MSVDHIRSAKRSSMNASHKASELKDYKRIIRSAIEVFAKKDWKSLLSVNVHESTLNHRIALYLENKFYGYSIDCEYNKSGKDSKLNSRNNKVRPDIIVHKRGGKNEGDNLVVIEVKKSGTKSIGGKSDIEKLRGYFSDKLNYELGVFIGVLKLTIDVCWIEKKKFHESCEVYKGEKWLSGSMH